MTMHKALYPRDDMNYMYQFANTPAQAKSLLHSLGQAAGRIGLNVNGDKRVHNL